ncbi:hypothetical protein [Mycolicibacter minnesotensis]
MTDVTGRRRTMRHPRRHRVAALLLMGLTLPGTPAATAQTAHAIRYVVTSDGGQDVEIHYRLEAPTENSSGAQYDHVWISPDQPWERTTTLDIPYRHAYVSVRNVWWNPRFSCEVWVDGRLAQTGTGTCVLTESRMN